MVSFIKIEQALPLRSEILRDNLLKPEDCYFDGDLEADSFHLGYFMNDELVSVASFHHQTKPGFEGDAYQLRGMATAKNAQGKGYGNQLINFAIVYLKGKKVNYLWCNARKVAFQFYKNSGFEFISEEFDIPGIGPHKVMYLKIQ